MRSYVRYSSLILSIAVSGILSGCFSSSKEVDTVPVPAPVVEQAPPAVVQVPAPVVMAPAAGQTTTSSTSWGNGAIEQKRTTESVNGDGTVQNRTTTTWNGGGGEPSQTTTTTTTNPY
jgi:hypothetical protein